MIKIENKILDKYIVVDESVGCSAVVDSVFGSDEKLSEAVLVSGILSVDDVISVIASTSSGI